jgi:hypothetical protein
MKSSQYFSQRQGSSESTCSRRAGSQSYLLIANERRNLEATALMPITMPEAWGFDYSDVRMVMFAGDLNTAAMMHSKAPMANPWQVKVTSTSLTILATSIPRRRAWYNCREIRKL